MGSEPSMIFSLRRGDHLARALGHLRAERREAAEGVFQRAGQAARDAAIHHGPALAQHLRIAAVHRAPMPFRAGQESVRRHGRLIELISVGENAAPLGHLHDHARRTGVAGQDIVALVRQAAGCLRLANRAAPNRR